MFEKYRQLGIKLTPQRLAILNYLSGNTSHPSAEDIYKAVLKQFPTMSFATIYNTIDALTAKGKVRILTVDPDKKRYDPNIEPHHHLFCVRCKNIVDVKEDFQLHLSSDITENFDVSSSLIEFHGTCKKCKN